MTEQGCHGGENQKGQKVNSLWLQLRSFDVVSGASGTGLAFPGLDTVSHGYLELRGGHLLVGHGPKLDQKGSSKGRFAVN